MRRVALALGFLVLAASTLVAAPGAESFRRHAVPGHGVSLAVPASWVASKRGLSPAVVEQMARENPTLAPFIRGLGGPNSPMKFIALNPKVQSGFATNANVVVVPVQHGITFEQYRRALLDELGGIVAGRIRQSVATIGGTKAVRVTYRLSLSFGRAVTVQTLQYAFLRPGRSVVVTYTTLPAFASSYATTFRKSAASIRFTN